MKITRVSQASGIERTLEIDVTEQQLHDWKSGAPIQDVVPHLTADEREFIMTGITKEEWDEMFPPEDDDDTAWEHANDVAKGEDSLTRAVGGLMDLLLEQGEEKQDG